MGGVDRLPSNLPIQNEEDEEGYAGGGIIAFAEKGQVVDPAEERRRDATNFNRAYWDSPEGKAETAQARRMGEPVTTAPSKIAEEFFTIQSGDPKQGSIETAKYMGISPNGLRYMQNPNLDVLEQMRIEDPKGYERFMGGNTISPEFGGSSITPEQDAERVAKIKEGLGYDPSTVYDFLRPPPKTATTKPEVLGSEFGKQGTITNRNAPAANPPGAGTPPAGGAPRVATPAIAAETAPAPKSALDQYADMLMEERKGIAKDRQQAKAMALLQTGLAIAGGTSPNPFANISQGALQGTQAYQQEMRGIRKEDADRLKQLMGLGISKEKMALEAKKLGITEKRFNQMYDLETAKLGVMGGQRADAAKNSEALRRDQLAANYFKTLYDKNPMATPDELSAMEATARRLARTADGSDTPTTNKYPGFSLVTK
jgi:hypothetical protein